MSAAPRTLVRACLIAMLAIIPATVLGAGPTEFETAYGMAADDVGTDQFASSLAMAKSLCTKDEYKCVSRLAELREQDAQQRKETESQPQPAARQDPVATSTTAPVASADVPVQRMAYVPTEYAVDLPTGFEDLASRTKPPSEWSGVKVVGIKENFPDEDKVCLMKDGMDLPTGPDDDVPVSDSNQKGVPVTTCQAMVVALGQSIWVPEGTLVEMLKWDPTRQVYVIKHAYECWKGGNFDGNVQDLSPYSCRLVKQ